MRFHKWLSHCDIHPHKKRDKRKQAIFVCSLKATNIPLLAALKHSETKQKMANGPYVRNTSVCVSSEVPQGVFNERE